MRDFLLEIGTEEMPVWAQLVAEKKLFSLFINFFKENHVDYGDINVSSTPRRVFLIAEKVAETQNTVVKKVKGPPIKVAYKDGKPTKALLGFLKQRNLKETDLEKEDGYIYATVKEGGKDTLNLLSESTPEIIKKIGFKKVMRWNGKNTFVRPVRWILALYGKEIVNFEIFGLKSSNTTQGHRFIGNTQIEISHPSEYEVKLAQNGVITDRGKRKKILREKLAKLADTMGGKPDEDEDLLSEVTGLVEWPGALYGSFDKRFLHLPHIVIKAAMKQHQRYFPVTNDRGELLPYFLSAINNEDRFRDRISPGMEKVLISRLEDAEFYFKEDMKISPYERADMLKDIVWIEGVGTVKDKTDLALSIAEYILKKYHLGVDVKLLKESIILSKFDLTTQMIRDGKEFTKLEGEIAKEYAKRSGIAEDIAEIIGQHMLPRKSGDRLPEIKEAALISIIFRALDLAALLKINYNFSSSKDPYGARRNTYAIFDILVNQHFSFNIKDMILKILELLNVAPQKFSILWVYIKERLFNFLEDREGIRYDIVDSIIEVSADIFDVWQRAKVLDKKVKEEPELFEKIAISLKRVNNILKDINEPPPLKENILNEYEKKLFETAKNIEPGLKEKIAEKDYEGFLSFILRLSPLINEFFDNVFVMAEDANLKQNRLALLAYIRKLFKLYGDFSKLVV